MNELIAYIFCFNNIRKYKQHIEKLNQKNQEYRRVLQYRRILIMLKWALQNLINDDYSERSNLKEEERN